MIQRGGRGGLLIAKCFDICYNKLAISQIEDMYSIGQLYSQYYLSEK